MLSSNDEYPFGMHFNFAVDNLFIQRNPEESGPFPPVSGNMNLLDNTPMLLLDNTPMLLL